jgi:hypothetical protein
MSLTQQIHAFALRALKRAGSRPVTQEYLRGLIRSAFAHEDLTDGDIDAQIKAIEEAGHISGTTDAIVGRLWLLTATGVIRANQLG